MRSSLPSCNIERAPIYSINTRYLYVRTQEEVLFAFAEMKPCSAVSLASDYLTGYPWNYFTRAFRNLLYKTIFV